MSKKRLSAKQLKKLGIQVGTRRYKKPKARRVKRRNEDVLISTIKIGKTENRTKQRWASNYAISADLARSLIKVAKWNLEVTKLTLSFFERDGYTQALISPTKDKKRGFTFLLANKKSDSGRAYFRILSLEDTPTPRVESGQVEPIGVKISAGDRGLLFLFPKGTPFAKAGVTKLGFDPFGKKTHE